MQLQGCDSSWHRFVVGTIRAQALGWQCMRTPPCTCSVSAILSAALTSPGPPIDGASVNVKLAHITASATLSSISARFWSHEQFIEHMIQ